MGEKFKIWEQRSSTNVLKLKNIPLPLKDEFIVLMEKAEVLYLEELEGKLDVFDNRNGGGSFRSLRVLEVYNCGLKYLFSPSTARGLVQLQELRVVNCEVMEEMVGNAEEKDEDAVEFRQLKRLTLEGLRKLRSFYPKVKKTARREGGASPSAVAQPLFNEKVAFPVLEELHLYDLGNTTEICSGHIPVCSFCKLRNLKVESCDNVLRVVSPNLLQRLQNLEELRVENCASLSVIFDLQGLNFGTGLLKFLSLVAIDLPKLTCLWNEDAHRILSFENLEELKIQNCELLRYLFHSSVAMDLVKLEILEIRSCRSLEEIVAKEGGEEVVKEIVSPQLKSMVLECPSLKKLRVDDCSKINTTALSELGSSKTKKSINYRVSD